MSICITLRLYVCMYVSMCVCLCACMSAKTVLTLRGMILTLWGQFCGVWHREVCSGSFGSFGSCGLEGGSPWIWHVQGKSHRCSTGVGSGEFGGQADILSFLSCSLGYSWLFLWCDTVLCPAGTCAWSKTVSQSTVQDAVTHFTDDQLRPKLRCPWSTKVERWLSHT